MERTERIREVSEALLEPGTVAFIDEMIAEPSLLNNDMATLREAVNRLFAAAEQAQISGSKGRVMYLCFSFLRSGIITGNHEVRIDLYDEDFYRDTTETTVYWSPVRVFENFNSQAKFLSREIRRKVERVRDYELFDYLKEYINNDYLLIQKMIASAIDGISEIISAHNIKTSEKVYVTFGGYMEKCVLLREMVL